MRGTLLEITKRHTVWKIETALLKNLENYSGASAAEGQHAAPHTYRTHAFSFLLSSSSSLMARGRIRTYDDDDENIAQYGTHTGQLMHCKHLRNLILEIYFMVN